MNSPAQRRQIRRQADKALVDGADVSFRDDIWELLERELPSVFKDGAGGGGEVDPDLVGSALEFSRILITQGLMTYSWPKEYGGQSGPLHRQAIINEALGYFRVPLPLSTGVEIVAPGLMLYGSEQQKREILPRIADASIIVNNGLTEPDAGSDLASLKCSAVRVGDRYLINGQKTYQSRAHYATHSFLAVRTDKDVPKHKGISLLLVDLSLPGVTIRPQWNIVDGRQNDVYFDDVEVPLDCLLGNENDGWQQLRVTLGFERSGVHVYGRSVSFLDELVDYWASQSSTECLDGRAVLTDLEVAHAQWRALCYRIIDLQEKGTVVDYQASEATLIGKLLKPMLADAATRLIGSHVFLIDDDPDLAQEALTRKNFERLFRESRSDHARGSVEVQKNIIATRGLFLPK